MLHIAHYNSYRAAVVFGDPWRIDKDYIRGMKPAHYPVPAIPNHLHLIAAEPLQAWEDFKAIGWRRLDRILGNGRAP